MSEKILAALDAMTERVLAYRPKDKGQWAAKAKRQIERKAKADE